MREVRLAFAVMCRELRGGLKGFRILILAMALGVSAIASVQSVAHGLMAGLVADGKPILGGDLALRQTMTPITPQQEDFLTRHGHVSNTMEMRAMARTDNASTLVELKAVDPAYPLYGQAILNSGLPLQAQLARRGTLWGAVAEAGLLARLGIAPGDHIQLGSLTLELRDVLETEPDRAGSASPIGFGPRLMISSDAFSQTGLGGPGSLATYATRIRLAPGETPERLRSALKTHWPDAQWRIIDFTNAAPRTARFINSLSGFLTLIGLTALLVGGVGVQSSVRSYLSGKLPVIATLKCLGASRNLVFLAYLFQVLALSLLGILLGLILGAATPPLLEHLLSPYLPISTHFSLDGGGLLLAALFGLMTALAFAILPIAAAGATRPAILFRGSSAQDQTAAAPGHARVMAASTALLLAFLVVATSPRPWLASGFMTGAILVLAAFRLAALGVMALARHVRRPRNPWLRLALSSLHRPDAATPDIIMSLGLGLTVLSAIALIESGFTRQVASSLPPTTPAFFFLDVPGNKITDFENALHEIPGAGTFNQTPFLRGRILSLDGVPASEKARRGNGNDWLLHNDRGITWAARQPEGSETMAGQWWNESEASESLVSIVTEMTDFFGVGVGDTLTVNVLGRDITARIAHVRRVDWSSYGINFAMVFSPGALADAPAPRLVTITATPAAEAEIQKTIPQRFPMVTLIRVRDALDTARQILSDIALAVRMVAFLAIAAGTLVLAGAVAAGHRRRIREAVILKVLGATRKDALLGFTLEYGLLGLITAILSCLSGTLVAWIVMNRVLELPWHFSAAALMLTVVLATFLTLAFGFSGAWLALGKKAAPLLRNE
ncbi:MAG: hypothetical protein A2018_00135 [Alphaproteobacteria bacterium GWF2_58_20]|nr:MAG: hypothetical protein A2018_00135 [Alphaproteobacteria bacterium GWF2_58_20]